MLMLEGGSRDMGCTKGAAACRQQRSGSRVLPSRKIKLKRAPIYALHATRPERVYSDLTVMVRWRKTCDSSATKAARQNTYAKGGSSPKQQCSVTLQPPARATITTRAHQQQTRARVRKTEAPPAEERPTHPVFVDAAVRAESSACAGNLLLAKAAERVAFLAPLHEATVHPPRLGIPPVNRRTMHQAVAFGIERTRSR